MFRSAVVTAGDAELQRLAAIRAALDPARRETRSDILTSAAVELLATKGDRSTSSLREALNQIWRTQAVTDPELEVVLEQAVAGGLVVTVSDLSGQDKWQATPGAADESRQDREWAQRTFDKFGAEVVERLDDLGVELSNKQRERTPHLLLGALASGCRVSEEAPKAGPEFLRPMEFDMGAVTAALSRVQPRPLRSALSELARAAADPDDDFANELVHMLVVGSILQCFISKRDLGEQLRLDTTRLLLDTTVLVDLVDDSSPSQKVATNVIALSRRLGVDVIVAEHTLEEWHRLWTGAESEHPEELDAQPVLLHMDRLALKTNPFVAQFLRVKALDRHATWARFRADRRNIRPVLEGMGVNVRPSGNDRDADQELLKAVKSHLLRLANDGPGAPKRTRVAAEADAQSAAMVARWRRRYPASPCTSYFVASDFLTGKAYELAAPDDSIPLTVKPSAWAVYVACLTADDPRSKTEIAEIVGSAVLRESFLGLATSYTLEEATLLADMLSETGSQLTVEDSRAAVQLDLLKLLQDDHEATARQRATAAAAEVMRRRSRRRDARAKRLERRATEVIETVTAKSEAEARAFESKLAAVKDAAAANATALSQEQETTKRLKRIIGVLIVSVALGGLVTGLVLSGLLHGKYAWVAYLLCAVYVAESVRFCWRLDVKWPEQVLAAVPASVWTVIGVILSAGPSVKK